MTTIYLSNGKKSYFYLNKGVLWLQEIVLLKLPVRNQLNFTLYFGPTDERVEMDPAVSVAGLSVTSRNGKLDVERVCATRSIKNIQETIFRTTTPFFRTHLPSA